MSCFSWRLINQPIKQTYLIAKHYIQIKTNGISFILRKESFDMQIISNQFFLPFIKAIYVEIFIFLIFIIIHYQTDQSVSYLPFEPSNMSALDLNQQIPVHPKNDKSLIATDYNSQHSDSFDERHSQTAPNKNPFAGETSQGYVKNESEISQQQNRTWLWKLIRNWTHPNNKVDLFYVGKPQQEVEEVKQSKKIQVDPNLSKFNTYTTPQGNLIWGAASILVYQDFKKHHISGKPLQFQSYKENTKNTLHALNHNPFSRSNISQEAIYVKSGVGKKIAALINRQVLAKFPFKTTPALDEGSADGFISYAYLFKALTYEHQFQRLPGILWFGKALPSEGQKQPYLVQGFGATNESCLKQIKIIDYNTNQDFFVGFAAKKANRKIDHIPQDKSFFSNAFEWIRSFFNEKQEQFNKAVSGDVIYILGYNKDANQTIDSVVDRVMKAQNQKRISQRPSNGNLVQFNMPVIDLDITHEYEQFKDLSIKNWWLRGQKLKMIQNIKLRMDEKGVVVQNDCFMGKDECAISGNIQISIQNPFWLVLTEEGKYPYLVAKINYLPEKVLKQGGWRF